MQNCETRSPPTGEELDNRRIADMRNLGPACEEDLNAVGICSAADLHQVGVKEAFVQLLIGRRQRGAKANCCNAAYLYALHGALHDIDWREVPESLKEEYKAFAAEIRQSGQFQG